MISEQEEKKSTDDQIKRIILLLDMLLLGKIDTQGKRDILTALKSKAEKVESKEIGITDFEAAVFEAIDEFCLAKNQPKPFIFGEQKKISDEEFTKRRKNSKFPAEMVLGEVQELASAAATTKMSSSKTTILRPGSKEPDKT